jgi:hypothetical protein
MGAAFIQSLHERWTAILTGKYDMHDAPDVLLLVDDHYLASTDHVRRRFYQPRKSAENPVFYSGQVPWEVMPLIFGSVRYDPIVKRYRMWYFGYTPAPDDQQARTAYMALAEGKDPVHWRRTEDRRMYVHEGRKRRTNILLGNTPEEIHIELGSVLIDPKAPNGRRYLLVYCAREARNPANRYYRLAWSSDGICWTPERFIPVRPPGRVDRHRLLRDPATGKYLFYFRGQRPFRKEFPTVDTYERTVCLQTSPDLKRWSRSMPVMTVDRTDPPRTNIYSLMPFFRGPTLAGVYQLHYPHRDEEVVTTHLCWSHDRVRWERRKEEFIPLGQAGEWDRFNNAVADEPVILGDTMYFYYSGRVHRHGGYKPRVRPDSGPCDGGIGIATMKVDRFASLEASFDGGSFTTRPMRWPRGKSLYINAEARWGTIRIDRATGKETASVHLKAVDGTKVPVPFADRGDGRTFRLRMALSNAKVYALYWE